MKVLLLHPLKDFETSYKLPPNLEDLIQDLDLYPLLEAMAQEDEFIFEVVRCVLFSSLHTREEIFYRQEILKDCLKHPAVVREIYSIPLEFEQRKKKQWLWLSPRHWSPTYILNSGRRLLETSLDLLWKLREIADKNGRKFESKGFLRFFTMVQQELDNDYLARVEEQIKALYFKKGILLSAQLGKGNQGINYMLCKPKTKDYNWLKRIFASRSPTYSCTLHPRDEHGARVLGELRDRGLARAASAVAQAASHIESFFNVLRWELAFYIGCLNLYEQLRQVGEDICFPHPLEHEEHNFSCTDLYDISLALITKNKVVGNDINGNEKDLVIITGANQGGKTTFLRSVGQAQLMLQAGMFVPAKSFETNLCSGVFTHFRRKEDKTLESGKFEEELKRMSNIVEMVKPNGLILLNESFASTNEREGSEIARQVVCALMENHIRIFYVTHLYDFASSFLEKRMKKVLFLRAERLDDGRRTFKIKEGEPKETSYGVDLYNRIITQRT